MQSNENSLSIEKVILARLGEIALKGLNRRKFEAKLIGNLRRKLKEFGEFKITQSQSRIWIIPREETADLEEAIKRVVKVFGLVSASIAWKVDKSEENIYKVTKLYLDSLERINSVKTFKIEAKRSDKNFPLNSPELCTELGAFVLDNYPKLKVDVHNPDLTLNIEIRDDLFIYSEKVRGYRGLPVGSAGKGLLLLSGGIDSPVAGFMMASRGMEIEAVYYHSYPYTSDQAKEKVIELASILKQYTGRIRLHIVDFTQIQLDLKEFCPGDMLTIHMRRVMMMIAEKIAKNIDAKALITGESLGQVASQTLEAINCTDAVCKLPVFRPLIGLDKEDAVDLARKIGTFETSILPFEDCCTLFVAKHPKTKPTLEYTLSCEEKVDIEKMANSAMENIEIINI